jgi:hypothetical protein
MDNKNVNCAHFWKTDLAGEDLVCCSNCGLSQTLTQVIETAYEAGKWTTYDKKPPVEESSHE